MNNSNISSSEAGKCPFMHGANTQAGGQAAKNIDWWPNQLNLRILHQNDVKANPLGKDFDYAEAFNTLDFAAVKKDIEYLLTDSKPW